MPREKKRRETEQGQEAQVPAGPLRGAAGENRDTGPVLRTPESIGLSPGRKAGGKRVRDAQVSRGDAISTTLADGDASQVENDPPEGENAEVRHIAAATLFNIVCLASCLHEVLLEGGHNH